MKQPAIILILVGVAVVAIQAMTTNRSCPGRVCEGPACAAPDFTLESIAKAGATDGADGAPGPIVAEGDQAR